MPLNLSQHQSLWLKPAARMPLPIRRRALERLVNIGLASALSSGDLNALHGQVISLSLDDIGLLWSGTVTDSRVILLERRKAPTHLATTSTNWLNLLRDTQPGSAHRQALLAGIHYCGHADTLAAIKHFLTIMDASHLPDWWQSGSLGLQRRSRQPLGLIGLSKALEKVVNQLYHNHPNAIRRLNSVYGKRFHIRIQESPWDLLFSLHRHCVRLQCQPRLASVDPATYDVSVSAPLRTLIDILEGEEDGDAQFFSRSLKVQGDMDILVMLRNVLDNETINLTDELRGLLGSAARPASKVAGLLAQTFGVKHDRFI